MKTTLESVVIVATGKPKWEDERVMYALEDFFENPDEKILISGTKGGKFLLSSQPGKIYRSLRKEGIPRNRFILETESKTTAENAYLICKKLKDEDIGHLKVVSQPTQLWRFRRFFNMSQEAGFLDKDVEMEYLPTVKNSLYEPIQDFVYGCLAWISNFLKYPNAEKYSERMGREFKE